MYAGTFVLDVPYFQHHSNAIKGEGMTLSKRLLDVALQSDHPGEHIRLWVKHSGLRGVTRQTTADRALLYVVEAQYAKTH